MLLTIDPKIRITADELLLHPWISNGKRSSNNHLRNAHEADTEAATINTKGCKSNSRQMGAKMGSIMAMVAIFEAISVKKLTTVTNRMIKRKRFIVPNTEI